MGARLGVALHEGEVIGQRQLRGLESTDVVLAFFLITLYYQRLVVRVGQRNSTFSMLAICFKGPLTEQDIRKPLADRWQGHRRVVSSNPSPLKMISRYISQSHFHNDGMRGS